MADSGREGRKRGRLSRSGDFDRAYRDGRSKANRFLVLYAFPRSADESAEAYLDRLAAATEAIRKRKPVR